MYNKLEENHNDHVINDHVIIDIPENLNLIEMIDYDFNETELMSSENNQFPIEILYKIAENLPGDDLFLNSIFIRCYKPNRIIINNIIEAFICNLGKMNLQKACEAIDLFLKTELYNQYKQSVPFNFISKFKKAIYSIKTKNVLIFRKSLNKSLTYNNHILNKNIINSLYSLTNNEIKKHKKFKIKRHFMYGFLGLSCSFAAITTIIVVITQRKISPLVITCFVMLPVLLLSLLASLFVYEKIKINVSKYKDIRSYILSKNRSLRYNNIN